MKLLIAAAVLAIVLDLPAAAQGCGPARTAINRRPAARGQVQVERHRAIYGRPVGYMFRSYFFHWNAP